MSFFGFGKRWREKRDEAALNAEIYRRCTQCGSEKITLHSNAVCAPCNELSNMTHFSAYGLYTDDKLLEAAKSVYHYKGAEFILLRDIILRKYEAAELRRKKAKEKELLKLKEWILK